MRRRHKSKFDYYHELGVEETADADQIKSAYRILAKRHHPDKQPLQMKVVELAEGLLGIPNERAKSEARFKKISEAYEVLSDPAIRKLYDNYEHPAVRVPPKPGDVNTDGTNKSTESIPRRSPFVDFIRDTAINDNARSDGIWKPKKPKKPFTKYQE